MSREAVSASSTSGLVPAVSACLMAASSSLPGRPNDMTAELREEEGCSDQDHNLAHRVWIRERHGCRAEGRGRLF